MFFLKGNGSIHEIDNITNDAINRDILEENSLVLVQKWGLGEECIIQQENDSKNAAKITWD